MGTIANTWATIKGAFVKAEPKASDLIEHGVLDNPTLWIVLGFSGLIVWLSKGILTESNYDRLYHLALVYIIGHVVIKVTAMIINGLLKGRMIDRSFKDGKLDSEETRAINSITISDK